MSTKEYFKIYYQNHKEQMKANARKWNAMNPKRIIMKKMRSTRPRESLVLLFGARCSNPDCLVIGGCTDIRCLQIDHINGGGKQEIMKFKSVSVMARYYLNHMDEAKEKLQILCANCNWIKRSLSKTEHGGAKLLEERNMIKVE